MASVSRPLCRCALSISRRAPWKRKCIEVPRYRQLSSTSNRLARDEDDEGPREQGKPFQVPFSVDLLNEEEKDSFKSLSVAEQDQVKETWLNIQHEIAEQADEDVVKVMRNEEVRDLNESFYEPKVPRAQLGYWAEDEDDEFAQVPDGDEGPEGDMTSIAHDELQLHREVREYTRLAAWDMPFLSKFAKPYNPPALTSPLRFRYTTYMGESHPASRKVVVEFSPADLKFLTPQQQLKLKKLVGARYNPERNSVKMSCEKFETPAQNKRYLGDLVNNLIKEAQDPNDTFEDIPLDLRHHNHKSRPRPKFPEQWKLNEKTATKVLADRMELKQIEEGTPIVDGERLVSRHIMNAEVGRQPTPVTVAAGGSLRPRTALRR